MKAMKAIKANEGHVCVCVCGQVHSMKLVAQAIKDQLSITFQTL